MVSINGSIYSKCQSQLAKLGADQQLLARYQPLEREHFKVSTAGLVGQGIFTAGVQIQSSILANVANAGAPGDNINGITNLVGTVSIAMTLCVYIIGIICADGMQWACSLVSSWTSGPVPILFSTRAGPSAIPKGGGWACPLLSSWTCGPVPSLFSIWAGSSTILKGGGWAHHRMWARPAHLGLHN